MAKTVFHVPASLNRSFLDHEITLTGGGWQARPSPIKQLLFFGGGILVTMWAATATFISSADPLVIVVFVSWALVAVVYLGGLTKTKELRFMTVPAFLAYLPGRARHVYTRRSSDPSEFYSIVGIDDVDAEGEIRFADGSVGQVYLVVGSASYLLFDDDRTQILDRVDAFWRKVNPSCEYVFVTTKEPQRIYHQVANLERRRHQLELMDPDLLELQDEQYDILTGHVGGRFTSIHQYVLLKGKSADALRQAHLILQAEVEGSPLVIKEVTVLDRDEALQTLRVFYQSTDNDPFTPNESLS
ncbi:hypothetical protein ACFOY4_01270 [Actinomadura syzygii]|uniref:Uncharacterized protein n=1 Tax=Actinomadura syzygii TaxID=1427538 RepID=A0A5D0TT50_9ACTN|nr:hypothetical protein [Actinomadura syzygii]TYC08620.1 hypothetical protein FXF65_37645 [Actinomadura syzygii]